MYVLCMNARLWFIDTYNLYYIYNIIEKIYYNEKYMRMQNFFVYTCLWLISETIKSRYLYMRSDNICTRMNCLHVY